VGKEHSLSDLQRLGRRLIASDALIQSIFNLAYCCIMSFAAVFLLRGASATLIPLANLV
jgi:hypothetical protein